MMPMSSRRFTLAGLLFGLSGAIAVIYEVLWMRRATAVFGASAPAVATVLSTFFAGFAVGAIWLGRWAAHTRRPLFAYGALEAAAALTALGVDPLFGNYERLVAILPPLHGGLAIGLRAALALVAFLPTTILLGGTFPVLSHGLGARPLTWLYSVNTAGAVAGALLVPFWLLPTFGVTTALHLTVGAGASVGAVAMLLGRGESRPMPGEDEAFSWANARPGRTATVIAFVSGFFVLAFETLAFRDAALVHSSSTQVFAVILAMVLAALALGAAGAGLLLGRRINTARAVLIALGSSGVLIALTPRVFLFATDGLAYMGDAVGVVSGRLIMAILLLVIPTAGVAGMVLPLVLGAARHEAAEGRTIGSLVAANTLGAIAGPLVASFVLVPWLGLWEAHLALGLVPIAVATVVARGRSRAILIAVTAALLLSHRGDLPRVRLNAALGQHVLSLREGVLGAVAVIGDRDGDRRIAIDNHYVIGGTASIDDERFQGHLPLLLHPAPRTVAFLGLGTGITAAAATLHDVDRAVAVELVAEVVTAARHDLSEANLGVVSRPEFTVVVDDARAFLAARGEAYDVIIGDLFVPWRAGEASLYTREAFAAARRRLRPGGLFCQWVPSYQLGEEELSTLVATFLEVFPSATLWRGDFSPAGAALALIGESDGYTFDPIAVVRAVRAAAPRVVTSAPALSDPDGLWLHFIGRLDPKSAALAAIPRNTDGTPWIELNAPRRFAVRVHNALRGAAATEGALTRLPYMPEPVTESALGPEAARAWRAGRLLGQASAAAARDEMEVAGRLGDEALGGLTESGRAALLAGRRGRSR